MIEQFYLIHRWDPNKYYHSVQRRPESNSNEEVLDISQKVQDWSGVQFSVIPMTLVGGFYPQQRCSWFILQPQSTGSSYGLVNLFNGVSTFMGYLILRPPLQKDSSSDILPIAGQKSISPKVILIAQLEFELRLQSRNPAR